MGINKINSKSNWGEAAADLNNNFDTLNADILKIKDATTRNKGFYSTSEALIAAVPTGQFGDVAYVGAEYPYVVYRWDGIEWANNGEVGGESVDLHEYPTKDELSAELSAQEERINEDTDSKISGLVVQETGDGEGVVMSQKAVTEKIAELGSELSSDRIALISGIFVNGNGIIENDSFSCTDYISVKEKDTLKYYNTISKTHSIVPTVVFFDENKQYIESIKDKELGLFNLSIDNGVSYVRLNVNNNYKRNFFIYISSVERLEENLQNNDKSISDLKDWHNNINANLGFSMFKLSDDSFTKGEYRNTAGIISALSSYIRTIPIYVAQGTNIIFTNSITITPLVSVVSEVDSEGNYLATILGGVSQTTGVQIEKDCYIEISMLSSQKDLLFINKSETINSINKSIYKNKESANMALVQSYESKDLQNKSNLVIGNDGTIISVPVSNYKIAYYISNEDNSNIKVEFLRNNTYSNCGNTCIADSIDDILEGNVLKFIHKFEYEKRETIDIVLNKGEVLAVSCLFGSTPDEIKCYVYNKNRIDNIEKRIDLLEDFIPSTLPTEYIGGDCSAFSKVLCIGDSLTQGVFNYDEIEGNTFTANREYSYPSNFSRISGCETINMGFGGITSYGWYSSYKDDERVLGNDCCIIALGVNDSVDTLETRSRDAFINIISLVKEKNKQIKIFLSGIINGKSYDATNELSNYAIKDKFIRDLYNELYANDEQVFFLDMVKYGHLQSLESIPSSTYPLDNYNMGHLSAYGYWRLAKDFYNYISYIMANDKDNVFRNIQFTGTDFYFKIP